MTGYEQRRQYAPDGRMRWKSLPLMLLPPLLTAFFGASALHWLFMRGWYLVLLAPMAVGGLVALVTWWSVGWSHCRKPWLATIVGLIMGLVTYMGYFQISMASTFGVGIHRVDLLPSYIRLRMATDIQEDQARPNPAAADPDQFMNWFTFLYEMLFVVGMTAGAARRRTQRAYDSENQCWLQKEMIALPHGAFGELTVALESGRTTDFCETYRPISGNPQSCCQVSLEYLCVDNVSPLQRPVYLTATESLIASEFKAIFSRSSMLVQRELSREEVLDFQTYFKGLDQKLREQHRELRDLPTAVAGVGQGSSHPATPAATIQAINEQDRTHVFSGWNLLIQNMIGGLMLVGFFGGAAVVYAAYHFHQSTGLEVAIVLASFGAGMTLAAAYVAVACPLTPEILYSQRLMRRCLQQRAGNWVRPQDRDAFFVGLSKRENWSKLKLETMTDAGYARIDASQSILLLECDAERIRVPRASILDCQPEMFQHPMDQQTEHWMVRLVINVPEGQREILLADYPARWSRTTNAMRQKRASELAEQINAM